MRGLKLHALSVVLLLANTGLVLLLFKVFESRETAGLVAGALFLATGGFVTVAEYLWGRRMGSVALWAALVFLVCAAIPIMGLRLAHPGAEFSELSLLGVAGPVFHKISSWLFFAMLAGVVVEGLRDFRSGKKLVVP